MWASGAGGRGVGESEGWDAASVVGDLQPEELSCKFCWAQRAQCLWVGGSQARPCPPSSFLYPTPQKPEALPHKLGAKGERENKLAIPPFPSLTPSCHLSQAPFRAGRNHLSSAFWGQRMSDFDVTFHEFGLVLNTY